MSTEINILKHFVIMIKKIYDCYVIDDPKFDMELDGCIIFLERLIKRIKQEEKNDKNM